MNNQLHINRLTQFNHLTREGINQSKITFYAKQTQFPKNQVNASSVLTRGYEADIVFWPKNPKANLLDAQMNANFCFTKAYENKRNWTLGENEPKTNPIQTQSEGQAGVLNIS
jgi:hypothetical protein